MTFRRFALLFFLCGCPLMGQQALFRVPDELANLDTVKKQLKQYGSCRESNCYVPQLERQADLAIGFLKESVASSKPGEKLAIVLDIDETALSNWAVETHDNFGYIPNDSNWCVSLRCGKAIAGTSRIFHEAEMDQVAVFFITGRPESQREDTAANLRAEGYDHWEGLYLRPEDHPKAQTVTEYESGDRGKIVANGFRTVLNVDDRLSDLAGNPQADHAVKPPNPFYFIP